MTICGDALNNCCTINAFYCAANLHIRFILTILEGKGSILTVSYNGFHPVLAGNCQSPIFPICAYASDSNIMAE